MTRKDMLRFPARDLKPYGEYVRSEDLVIGEVLFALTFWTMICSCPRSCHWYSLVGISTPVTKPGDLHFCTFKTSTPTPQGSAMSRLALPRRAGADHQSFEDLTERPSFECTEETEYTGVLEFEKALDQLLGCSLRRNPSSRT